jgi:hypothetical protein
MAISKPYPHPDDWQKVDTSLPLHEMAFSKDKVERELTCYHGAIFTHLLKLFYFRDFSRYFNNWSSTVFKCAFQVSKIKKKNGKDKYPDAEDIYYWMWGGREDAFGDHHRGMLKDFNNKSDPEYQDLPYVHAGGDEYGAGLFIKDYHLWLARKLSANGKVTKNDVQDKIKELFKKYPYNR